MVPAQMNKLPVAGQNAYKAAGPDPQETPTPLHSRDKHTPLQVYETSRPFFGSAPVGGLDILCSESMPLRTVTNNNSIISMSDSSSNSSNHQNTNWHYSLTETD